MMQLTLLVKKMLGWMKRSCNVRSGGSYSLNSKKFHCSQDKKVEALAKSDNGDLLLIPGGLMKWSRPFPSDIIIILAYSFEYPLMIRTKNS